ncbi:hypothetical protein MKW98_013747 [Papaver atlanticum]|uniref:Peptidase A1 domain-containing protein n=1 Tax=Papaver atlanticum TaxID=357466 RepID=A0AAD4T030_9MAGN|nr:hypothetical protein MKW98_013747 [Papaver atlanticum]
MASSAVIHFLLFFVFASLSNAQIPITSSKPASIFFNLERDPSTLQYMIKINQGTPRTEVKLVLDLGGKLPWLRCDKSDYESSSYHPVSCTSPQCSLANNSKPAVGTSELCSCTTKNASSIYTSNPVTHSVRKGELVSDLMTITSNPDSQATPVASPRRISFGCATAGSMLSGLDKGAKGVAGLGRSSSLSLVPQFAVAGRFSRIFALQLNENGGENQGGSRIYFGGGPYVYINWVQTDFATRILTYTPLLVNPKSREEYFIDLKSIKVHTRTLQINKKLLSINKKTGTGGTKVDIRIPYTTLETSIYKAFIKSHIQWTEGWNIQNGIWKEHPLNISRVAPVAPFTACYNSSTMPRVLAFSGDYAPSGPSVSFILPEGVVWNITLFDLVRVNDGVDCVGVLDGGSKPTTSVVIGARQISFLEFDISRSRLGFVEPNLHES